MVGQPDEWCGRMSGGTRYNVGGKPAVPANDPYSSVFKASEIVLVIDLRNKSNFYIGLGVLQGNFVELLMFS